MRLDLLNEAFLWMNATKCRDFCFSKFARPTAHGVLGYSHDPCCFFPRWSLIIGCCLGASNHGGPLLALSLHRGRGAFRGPFGSKDRFFSIFDPSFFHRFFASIFWLILYRFWLHFQSIFQWLFDAFSITFSGPFLKRFLIVLGIDFWAVQTIKTSTNLLFLSHFRQSAFFA